MVPMTHVEFRKKAYVFVKYSFLRHNSKWPTSKMVDTGELGIIRLSMLHLIKRDPFYDFWANCSEVAASSLRSYLWWHAPSLALLRQVFAEIQPHVHFGMLVFKIVCTLLKNDLVFRKSFNFSPARSKDDLCQF